MTAIAIEGVRRTVKERVDGTLVLSVEISPIHKADFHRLFPDIDMPLAIAPLNLSTKPPLPTKHEQAPNVDKPGPLCILAVQWCRDQVFQEWMRQELEAWSIPFDREKPFMTGEEEEMAKWAICRICGINSRKELDTNPEAAHIFKTRIRTPYMAHLNGG